MDEDIAAMSWSERAIEIKRLRNAIRTHRSQKADDRCIDDDDNLYAALNDGIKCDRRVGNKDEMLKNCARFIDRRCQQGHWPTYAELEKERDELKAKAASLHQGYVHNTWLLTQLQMKHQGRNCDPQ